MLPSKSQVRKAGKRIAEALDVNYVAVSDINMVDDWRKAHLTPLTSIAMWLRKPSIDATGLAPAQRLKRRGTVLDKLIHGRAVDASTMHDLGGCRLIFPDLQSLQDFREFLETRTRAGHKLLHDRSKYDYIALPKETGYRGVHYVYSYQPTSAANIELKGLKIEIQLRTDVQHAWATSVEIADLVLGARTKFEDGTGQYGEFFRIASELLARRHEGMTGCLPDLTDAQLSAAFHQEERAHNLLDRLDRLREQGDLSRIKEHTVLAFQTDGTLNIFGYTKSARAVEKERDLLDNPNCAQVVYVRASTPGAIKNSYRNYLTNPADFVKLMREALE
ncbi:RelA/SpoT domain-containing protein [Xanthomonas campestris pv. campestris]|uniref:RelA/SpoT domain-containing protein n=1 Tax=Xanthomonas campestris TaxID=339 RepID=UPI002367FFF5|nr:RelA/SpoT domain-containing protein [Xanthomonas campestris]WDJ93932.1 RelA/SpoT domain-containing protein [Xanthomonas campestris pv. incanae]